MKERKSRHSPLLTIIVLLLMAPALLIVFVYLASSVAGTATLPNGIVATINGPFAASENSGRTTVDASGRKFVFARSVITVDGTTISNLDASILQVAIDARGYDAELSLNGKRVSLPPR